MMLKQVKRVFLCWVWVALATVSIAEPVNVEYVRYQDDPAWFARLDEVFTDYGKLAEAIFNFPNGLNIRFKSIGQANAYYDRRDHSITLGRELILEAKDYFVLSGCPERESILRAKDVLLFVYLHELGHAAVGELSLPIVGREEDAVDEFATMIFVLTGKGDYAVAAADYYGIRAKTVKQDYFSDTHSLDPQRFANIYALLYGADPETFYFVKDMISSNRCDRAAYDFQRKWNSWHSLLRPYLRYDAFAKRASRIKLEFSPRSRDKAE